MQRHARGSASANRKEKRTAGGDSPKQTKPHGHKARDFVYSEVDCVCMGVSSREPGE